MFVEAGECFEKKAECQYQIEESNTQTLKVAYDCFKNIRKTKSSKYYFLNIFKK